MKRKYVILVLTILLCAVTVSSARALDSPNDMLITEVQTGTSISASEEFIEIYNASPNNIDVSTWRLEYFSSTALNFDNPTRKIPLHGIVGSHKYFLAASTNYLVNFTNESFAATLSKTGGHVRLVSQATTNDPIIVHDLLGWGTAQHPEGIVTTAPVDSKSLLRRQDQTANYLDTGNNATDFVVNDNPSPQSDAVLSAVPEEPPPANPVPDPIPTAPSPDEVNNPTPETPPETIPATVTSKLLPPRLSEIFPNPASPASDDTDEYVELFNPNNDVLSLAGYKLQTGNTFSYSYTFSKESLAGQSSQAFMVTQTGDVLANAGGKVRLIDPLGNVIDETTYTTAEEGQAWAKIDGTWLWTTIPTPNAANMYIPSITDSKTSVIKKSATSKPKAAKPTSTKKSAAKKSAIAKTAKKSASGDDKDEPVTSVIHPFILAAITLAAVGYAIYEYRDDIANRIYQFRRNRENRRIAGEER